MHLSEKQWKTYGAETLPLTEEIENAYLKIVPWEIDRTGIHKIRKVFSFKNFRESMEFANRIAEIAEREQHHPELHLSVRKVIVELHTHAALGLSINDFIMAEKIDILAMETAQ